MSLDRAHQDTEPVTSVSELEAYFRSAERAPATHQVGLEHEKFLYPRGEARAIPYEGERGIGALLEALSTGGYESFREAPGAPVIALMRGKETISLEPGGQFELSGSPFATAREAHAENLRHLAEVRAAGAKLGLFPVGLGYRPFQAPSELSWMPKTRYQVMRSVLPPRGHYALDMMLMTATGQVSLDWENEEDCARKMTVTARASPLLVALYANSPLVQGKPSGFLSFRSQVWTDVDRARCGYFPAMLDGRFSYRSYVEWAIDAPMLFLRRDGRYLRPALTFRQLLRDGFEGKPATAADWTDHLSTLFPEVRIKKVLEVRAADCASAAMTGALAALFRGLLYDKVALADAEALLPKLGFTEHLAFQDLARKEGLRGRLGNATLAQLSEELVGIARQGLLRLDAADAPLLDPLLERARAGRSLAEEVLEAWAERPDPAALLARYAL